MSIIYMFNQLTNEGLVTDLRDVKGIVEDENWFHSRKDAISWFEKQKPLTFDGLALVLVEMFFQ